MGALRRYWEILKMLFMYIKFKFRQYQLKTNENVVVDTIYGPVKGVKRFSCWKDQFYSFEKIPFAKPPLGELRFKAPQPPEKWTEVKDCTKEGPAPLQFNLFIERVEGSEDCLYLNVYSKNINPSEPLPVMVWIYGGGFEMGGTSKDLYSPDYFMQKDIVLISITYRVGPFGFLSFNDPSIGIPGNAGLKDQILALKWVKENVNRFGGDADNITLFGESAGSASVHYLTLTEQTAGLFHKAILMSGTVLCPWAKQHIPDLPHRAAKFAGYNGSTNEKEIYEFLKNANALDLVCVGEKLFNKEDMRNRLVIAYGPVVEPYITDDCVVPKEPRLMLKKAWGNKIPILIGCTADEGLLFFKHKKDTELLDELGNCEYMVPLELGLDRKSERCTELGLKIKEAHYGNRYANHFNFKEYMDLMKYKTFWHGNHRTCLARLNYSSARTFLYRFDVDSPDFNIVRRLFAGKTERGVCHGDDVGYIFHNLYAKDVKSASLEYKTIQRMVSMWTSFAKKGNPNDDIILPVVWSPLNSTNNVMKCLNIGNELEFIDLPEAKKLEIWDSIYDPEKLF